MLHIYPLGHSHACRSEVLECKNESYQGRTYGTTVVDNCLMVDTPSTPVGTYCPMDRTYTSAALVGQRNLKKRLLQDERVVTITRAPRLTSNRHASLLPESYAKSLVYSFGLRGDDHGEAMGVLNESRAAASIGSSSSSNPMLSSFFSVV